MTIKKEFDNSVTTKDIDYNNYEINVVFSDNATLEDLFTALGSKCIPTRIKENDPSQYTPNTVDVTSSDPLKLHTYRLGSKNAFSIDYRINGEISLDDLQKTIQDSPVILAAGVIYGTGELEPFYIAEGVEDGLEGEYAKKITAPTLTEVVSIWENDLDN